MLISLTPILALTNLSIQIGKSKNLSKNLPVRVITTGGFVSVACLRNRHVTADLDYVLDPILSQKLMMKLEHANKKVSKGKKIDEHWFNSSLSVFIMGDKREKLFQDSIEQGLILWESSNLVVYACKWEWALDRKLKRYKLELRNTDMWDSVFILDKIIYDRGGKPIGREEVKSWYPNMYEPLDDSVLDMLATTFQTQFGKEGLIG